MLDSLGGMQRQLGPELTDWVRRLRQRVCAVAVDNMRRDGSLRAVLAQLTEAGVETILLKGSALRLTRLGSAGRFQCDVDLLLRRCDLERAERLLLGEGFRLVESGGVRQWLLAHHFHLGFARNGAVIELHWDLDHGSPHGFTDRLWENSRAIDDAGCPRRVLSSEHGILFGCLHLSRHAFESALRWLADLRSHLPVPVDVAHRLAAEVDDWPARAVRTPIWLLAELGVDDARALNHAGEVHGLERALLRQLLPPLLLGEPWLGIPPWRLARALHAWLFSERSLTGLLTRVATDGTSGRLRAVLAGARIGST